MLLAACGDSSSTNGGQGEGGSGAGNNGGDNTGAGAGNGGDSTTNTGASSMGGSTSSTPLVGCAASFDGSDDVLLADVAGEAGLVDDFSLAVSIRPESLTEGQVAFVAGRHLDGSSNGYYLALLNEGGLKARMIVFTASGGCQATAPLTDPGDGFVHVLGTFDSPNTRVFIDGQLASDEPCGNFMSSIEPTSVISIGRSATGLFPFGGDIDDVLYLPSATSADFDPADLACVAGAVRYDFDGTAPAETSIVAEACGNAADATVGTASGADGADPTFVCAR